jgi:hypothetical protein
MNNHWWAMLLCATAMTLVVAVPDHNLFTVALVLAAAFGGGALLAYDTDTRP